MGEWEADLDQTLAEQLTGCGTLEDTCQASPCLRLIICRMGPRMLTLSGRGCGWKEEMCSLSQLSPGLAPGREPRGYVGSSTWPIPTVNMSIMTGRPQTCQVQLCWRERFWGGPRIEDKEGKVTGSVWDSSSPLLAPDWVETAPPGSAGVQPVHRCLCSAKSLQSYPTLCDPMDCSPPDSSVHGIFQVRILKQFAMPFSRGSSWPNDWTYISCGSCIAGRFFTTGATWKALSPGVKLWTYSVQTALQPFHTFTHKLTHTQAPQTQHTYHTHIPCCPLVPPPTLPAKIFIPSKAPSFLLPASLMIDLCLS